MAWSRAEIELLSKRMAGRPTGFRVSARTAPLVIEAVAFYAREGIGEDGLGYKVDLWTPDASSVLEVVARAGNLHAARAAYEAALANWPGQPLTLRKATRTLARTRPEE